MTMGKYSYVMQELDWNDDRWQRPGMTYLTSDEALIEVQKWVNDFLRYNNMENYQSCLSYHQTAKGTMLVNADEEHYFVVYPQSYCNMKSEAERRMHVWKLLCDADLVDRCRLAIVNRLEAANSEYEEILAAQDLGA